MAPSSLRPVLVVPFHIGEPTGVPVPDGAEVLGGPLPMGTPTERMAELFGRLATKVAAAERPIVLAGDCMAPLGVLTGLQRRGIDPVLVWVDAHGDFNTPETTPSGYLGGLPLAMAVGRGDLALTRALGTTPLDEGRVVLVDARDLDPPEAEALAASGVRQVGLSELVASALPEGPVMLHLDIDVIDEGEAPGLRFPAGPGPTATRVLEVLRRLLADVDVVAVSVAHTVVDGPAGALAAALTERVVAGLIDPR